MDTRGPEQEGLGLKKNMEKCDFDRRTYMAFESDKK
jgi:hypothetical protein